MPNFLVHDETTIVNAIVADSLEVAQSVTGLMAFLAEDGGPWIGWTLYGNEWRPPMPTIGVWEWDDATREWIDVTPEPEYDSAPEE